MYDLNKEVFINVKEMQRLTVQLGDQQPNVISKQHKSNIYNI